jgi:hypothetical protein
MQSIILKRDGTVEAFDAAKIRHALQRAFDTTRRDESSDDHARFAQEITDAVVRRLVWSKAAPTVEDVQDLVETSLMAKGCYDVAKHYIAHRNEHARLRATRGALPLLKIGNEDDVGKTPWGELGFVVLKRSYARLLNDGVTENWPDTIRRVLAACQGQLKCGFSRDEVRRMYDHMLGLRGTVAGRFLWQLGTSTVEKLGLASLQNCAFASIDKLDTFTWAFDMLMLGSGVGFSIQRCYVDCLPAVLDKDVRVQRMDVPDADFIVPDSRAGWVALLDQVLQAFFVTGKSFSYSAMLIRSAGTPIKGFGGVASGPNDLCKGIDQIVEVLRRRRGDKLRPIDCLDVMNIIGSIVVSGNVRRSAQLAIGDPDDTEFLRAKRWDLGSIPNWRSMSNNSVACEHIDELHPEFWEAYSGGGEPYGLVNLGLSRRVGRLCDGDKYPDPHVKGYNPCAEQGLADRETCCLAELFLPNNKSYDQIKDVAFLLYRVCKHSLRLPCHLESTEAIVHAQMRMGIGVTGYLQATEEQRQWLPRLYEELRAYDAAYSDARGWPRSVKLTTVKPSGTLSLLPGVTPGWHPALYKHYIRRVRMASNHPLLAVCRDHGLDIEPQLNFDGSLDRETSVVSFPCRTPDGVPLADDLTAVQELEIVKRLQTEWSDNAVSNTIYYSPGELDGIKAWLKQNYRDSVKSVSFLLKYEHGFKQAPFEAITADEYGAMMARTRPIRGPGGVVVCRHASDEDVSDAAATECPGGACPLR